MNQTPDIPTRNRERLTPERDPRDYAQDDEISLIDIWLVLVKHKLIIGVVFALTVLGALAFAFASPYRYTVSSTIEIGNDDQGNKIEPPETVLTKLTSSYIPLAQQEYLKEHEGVKGIPKIDASIPSNSQLIILKSEGVKAQAELLKELQQASLEFLKHDHQRTHEVLKKELELQRQSEITQMEDLQDRSEVLAAEIKRLDELEQLLTRQRDELQALLDQASDARIAALKETGGAARNMALLIVDNDLQETWKRLAELEERLFIELPRKRDELKKSLAENQREQTNQKTKIAKIEAQIGNTRETRAVVSPMQSLEPAGPRRTLIVALGAILGLMLSLFAAFFAEFLVKVRERTKSMDAL